MQQRRLNDQLTINEKNTIKNTIRTMSDSEFETFMISMLASCRPDSILNGSAAFIRDPNTDLRIIRAKRNYLCLDEKLKDQTVLEKITSKNLRQCPPLSFGVAGFVNINERLLQLIIPAQAIGHSGIKNETRCNIAIINSVEKSKRDPIDIGWPLFFYPGNIITCPNYKQDHPGSGIPFYLTTEEAYENKIYAASYSAISRIYNKCAKQYKNQPNLLLLCILHKLIEIRKFYNAKPDLENLFQKAMAESQK